MYANEVDEIKMKISDGSGTVLIKKLQSKMFPNEKCLGTVSNELNEKGLQHTRM